MKKIFTQKNLFIFMNIVSGIMVFFSIVGGVFLDREMFYLLFVSLFFALFSLLFLINQIHYDEKIIKFNFVLKKIEKSFCDIKEIFYVDNGFTGCIVVFNFESETDGVPINYLDYLRKCKNLDCFYVSGIAKRDLKLLLKNCKCRIIY